MVYVRKNIRVNEYKPTKEISFEPINTMKDETIPQQAWSVRDLLERHKRGITPKVLKRALYEMDVFGEEGNPLRAQNFDLSDLDAIETTIKRAQYITNRNKQKQLTEAKKAEKEQILEEYKKSLTEKEETPKE